MFPPPSVHLNQGVAYLRCFLKFLSWPGSFDVTIALVVGLSVDLQGHSFCPLLYSRFLATFDQSHCWISGAGSFYPLYNILSFVCYRNCNFHDAQLNKCQQMEMAPKKIWYSHFVNTCLVWSSKCLEEKTIVCVTGFEEDH